MTTIEKRTIASERIEKQGKPKMIGIKVSKCKSMAKVFEAVIGHQSKKGNIELEMLTRGLYEHYKIFHPPKIVAQEIKGWKGKSGITNIEKFPDRVILTRYQKPSKDEEPKEVRIEILKHELIPVVNLLSKLKIGDKIKTRAIAKDFSYKLGLNLYTWDMFFANRHYHNLLTNILGFLDAEGYIHYSGGVTEILKDKLELQLLLPS